MYTKENSVLIINNELPTGYFIIEKSTQSYVILEDINEAHKIIDNLLKENGIEIYDDIKSFYVKYPQISNEGRAEISKRNFQDLIEKAKNKK